MAVVLKTADEIERMRVAGRLASEVLDFITPHVKPGVTTGKLNDLCHEYMVGVQRTVPGVGFQSWTTPAATTVTPLHASERGRPAQNALLWSSA